jgi:hypothetical protein
MAPASVHATLLDEGVYLGSVAPPCTALGATRRQPAINASIRLHQT